MALIVQTIWTASYFIAVFVLGWNARQTWVTFQTAKEGGDRVSIDASRLAFGVQAGLGIFAAGMFVAGLLAISDISGMVVLWVLTLGAPFIAGLSIWVAIQYRRIFNRLRAEGRMPDRRGKE